MISEIDMLLPGLEILIRISKIMGVEASILIFTLLQLQVVLKDSENIYYLVGKLPQQILNKILAKESDNLEQDKTISIRFLRNYFYLTMLFQVHSRSSTI